MDHVNEGLTSNDILSLVISSSLTNPNDHYLLAVTSGAGIFLSTDYGASWTEANDGLTGTYVKALVTCDTSIFAGTRGGGVFLSNNNGTNWKEADTGLSDKNVSALAVSNQYLFAGTDFGGVWRKSLVPAGLSEEHSPGDFTLAGNFPNPFSQSTTIQYAISSRRFVQLKVFDVNGKEVTKLVDEYQSSGSYSVVFNAVGLLSGIYFYQIKSDDKVETRKMIIN